ncbi:MAG: methionyl-tRNA formyltransferase [Mycobacteriales bacterium]
MRLVFAGTPVTALPALQALLASPRHEVAAVLTRPDAPAGRGRRVAASPVAELARAEGVAVLSPRRLADPAAVASLAEVTPDCCPVVAYGALVPPAALAIPPRGWVNLHFSVLPAWRGAAPVQRAILAGDEITGATTFLLEEGLDTGPVFGTLTEPIRLRDTTGDLLARLAAAGARLLVATLDGIEDGRLAPVPQPAEGVSLAPKFDVAEARVDWTAPALRVDRLTRAAWPAPGAWTEWRGERLKLAPVLPLAGSGPEPALAPGEVADLGAAGVCVGTGTRPVVLGDVQPAGKARMAATAWARGARLAAGERCR